MGGGHLTWSGLVDRVEGVCLRWRSKKLESWARWSMVVDRGRVGMAGSVGIADILGACRLSSALSFRKEIVYSVVLSAAPRSAGVWS